MSMSNPQENNDNNGYVVCERCTRFDYNFCSGNVGMIIKWMSTIVGTLYFACAIGEAAGGVLRGGRFFRSASPKLTSLGTFLFNDKKVPRRRQLYHEFK